MATSSTQKLSLFVLTSMVVESMVGAGIFFPRRSLGIATGPFGATIACSIAAVGMDIGLVPRNGNRIDARNSRSLGSELVGSGIPRKWISGKPFAFE